MSDYCVVVADCSRARFFTLEAAEVPGLESGPNLVERDALVNPEAALPGRDAWTDPKSGRNTAPGGGPAHGYDDHRDNHEEEYSRRFAKRVVAAALEFARRHQARRLVLVAGVRMLGLMREALAAPAGLEIREVAKDLARQAPHEIHEHLCGNGLLPARRRAAV